MIRFARLAGYQRKKTKPLRFGTLVMEISFGSAVQSEP
jgi:hypothetical protein